MNRIEKDPEGRWIARRRDGSIITDEHWRWNSRAAARNAVAETDMLEEQQVESLRRRRAQRDALGPTW